MYYPEILKDQTGDPLARNSGCTGEAQESNPQLVSANLLAAGLALQLFSLWHIVSKVLETIDHLPYRLNANLSKLSSMQVKDSYDDKNKK